MRVRSAQIQRCVILAGMGLVDSMIDHPDLVKDWKITCRDTDGCSSMFLKHIARWWLNIIGTPRNYRFLCVQHDFDYRFGPKYGIYKNDADKELRDGIKDAGHPWIAKAVYSALVIAGWKAWNDWRIKEKSE